MDESIIYQTALRHKEYLFLCGLLILVIGIIATACVGEAIQLKDGTVEFQKFKVSIGSGSTFVVFSILSGWVFYLGSRLTVEIEQPPKGKIKITIRRIQKKEVT